MSVLLNNSRNRLREVPGVGRPASPSRECAVNRPPSDADAMVFVVDDDAPTRESLKNLIRSVGLRVEVFDSAEEFLLGQRPNLPRCLVLDVHLPGLSGLDLQKRMAEIAMEIPTIFISGHADIPMSVHAMKAGAAEFLIKPFRDQDLIDAIQRAIQRDQAGRRRVAKLTEASEALRRCLDALPLVPEVDDFLGQVLATVTRQLDASSSVLFLRSGKPNFLTLDLVVEEGSVRTPIEANYPQKLRFLRLDKRAVEILQQPAAIIDLINGIAPIPHAHRSHLLRLGIKTLLIVPLRIARELIGCLNFRFMEYRKLRQEDIEIARALATQTSLAIQLTRLAKTARQTGILEERNRLAGEIHDSLAQSFTGVCLHLSLAAEAKKKNSKESLNHIERAIDVARFGLSEARRSAFSLGSRIIEESGLIHALKALVERSNIPGRLSCTFCSDLENDENLAVAIRQDLVRIAQEAISNAVRHAEPRAIAVSLRLDPPSLVLEVKDNGCGMTTGAETSDGFGLVNMRARVNKLNGLLNIRTAPGRGTSIVVTVPVEG
jgi:signal transduction histidine kinase